MPSRKDVTHQPLPQEYDHKRDVFARLTDMAMQMQRQRRAMGYQWLEGGLSVIEGLGDVRVHARQSGLILVNIGRADEHLYLEPLTDTSDTKLAKFHRAQLSRSVGLEYVWDEAMFAPAQS